MRSSPAVVRTRDETNEKFSCACETWNEATQNSTAAGRTETRLLLVKEVRVADYITTQGSVLGLITQSSPYADHCVQVTQGWDYTPPELNYVRGRQGLNPPRMESQLELAGASTKCPLEHLFPANRARLATLLETRNADSH